MRKDYITWNKDSIDDQKIADDLKELSDGKLQLNEDILALMAERMEKNYRQQRPAQKNVAPQKQNKNKKQK
jgi:hypothetical protein